LDGAELITFVFKHSEKGEMDEPDLRADGAHYVDPDNPGVYQPAVIYLWQPADTSTIGAGEIRCEVDVTWAPGQIETFPNKGYFTFTIEEDLDVQP
jgi:hypothetical protein